MRSLAVSNGGPRHECEIYNGLRRRSSKLDREGAMKNVVLSGCVLAAAVFTAGLKHDELRAQATKGSPMDTIADQYVKLVLAMGQHDPDYVDAYYGPPEWKKEAETSKIDLDGIGSRARALTGGLARQHQAAQTE